MFPIGRFGIKAFGISIRYPETGLDITWYIYGEGQRRQAGTGRRVRKVGQLLVSSDVGPGNHVFCLRDT